MPSSKGESCEKCGATVAAEAVFCSRCGTKLQHPSTCATCGAALPAAATYCKKCGSPVGPPKPIKIGPEKPGQKVDDFIFHPSQRSSNGAVAAIFIVLTIVLAGLIYTGDADGLLGRHWYTGANPPTTNVTVVGVDGTLTTVVGGVPYTNGSWFIPASSGFSYCPPSGNCTLHVQLSDPSATHSASFTNFSLPAPFKLAFAPSTSPIFVGVGQPVAVEINYVSPSQPGTYWLPLEATATVS
jgi:ribosomal protein L40E